MFIEIMYMHLYLWIVDEQIFIISDKVVALDDLCSVLYRLNFILFLSLMLFLLLGARLVSF